MLYLVGIFFLVIIAFFLLIACFKVVRGLVKEKSVLLEHGIHPALYFGLHLSLWLFAIGLLASTVPAARRALPLAMEPAHALVFPGALALFVPGIVLGRISTKTMPSGYDFQAQAAQKLDHVFWLGCGGLIISLVLGLLNPFLWTSFADQA